jgi:hypothetical protein
MITSRGAVSVHRAFPRRQIDSPAEWIEYGDRRATCRILMHAHRESSVPASLRQLIGVVHVEYDRCTAAEGGSADFYERASDEEPERSAPAHAADSPHLLSLQRIAIECPGRARVARRNQTSRTGPFSHRFQTNMSDDGVRYASHPKTAVHRTPPIETDISFQQN